ncbi:hypothetical protein [Natrinema soli]|uniref:Uncharacterized protein n=1 Tax=Natrinema soli TaxID=1930624 RepID=A0ABD5SP01_9EURY
MRSNTDAGSHTTLESPLEVDGEPRQRQERDPEPEVLVKLVIDEPEARMTSSAP